MHPHLERFESHVQNRVNPPPLTLYKYMSCQTAKLVLEKGTVLFRSPLEYNDPFDSQWDPFWAVHTEEAQVAAKQLVRNAIENPATWPSDIGEDFKRALEAERERILSLPTDQQLAAFDEFASLATTDRSIPPELITYLRDVRRRMRVFCCSATPTSILLWSHYGDEHRGVAIAFDTSALEQAWTCPAEPVEYLPNPPALVDVNEWNHRVLLGCHRKPGWLNRERAWALAKHHDWSYEQEWRFVTQTNKGDNSLNSAVKYPAASIKQVIFGCKATTQSEEDLKPLIRSLSPDISVARIEMHPSQFALRQLSAH